MITSGQVSVTGTKQPLCPVPPGPCVVIISSDPASADTAYYGADSPAGSGTFAASNGIPLPAGTAQAMATGKWQAGQMLYVITSTGTATVGWLIAE